MKPRSHKATKPRRVRPTGTKGRNKTRAEDIREWLDRRPFNPFRIRLRDGRSFKVGKLHKCIVGVRAVYIGVPDLKLRGCVKRVDYCPYDYAVSIEQLNRKQRKRTGRNKRE